MFRFSLKYYNFSVRKIWLEKAKKATFRENID